MGSGIDVSGTLPLVSWEITIITIIITLFLKSTLITCKGFSHHKENYKSNRDKLTQHGTLNRNRSQQVTTRTKAYDQCSKKEIYNMQ